VSSNAGAIANKNNFSPFGEITTLAGTTFGFTGQRFDAELGLLYFKRRYMSAKLGRFLQPDPVGYTGKDFNLYSYVRNSPLLFTDPMGLQQKVWVPGTGDDLQKWWSGLDDITKGLLLLAGVGIALAAAGIVVVGAGAGGTAAAGGVGEAGAGGAGLEGAIDQTLADQLRKGQMEQFLKGDTGGTIQWLENIFNNGSQL